MYVYSNAHLILEKVKDDDSMKFKNVYHDFRDSLNFTDNKDDDMRIQKSHVAFLYKYLKPHLKSIFSALFLIFVLVLFSLPGPYLNKVIIDNIFPNKDLRLFLILIFTIAGLKFFSIILDIILNYILTKLNQKVLSKIKVSLFKALLAIVWNLDNGFSILKHG